MADVTEMTTLNGAPPPINVTKPPKRPRGRPRKVAKPAEPEVSAASGDEDTDETQTSGNSDFWLMLQNFTDDEWNHLSAYVYRLAPTIDRKANGRKANIQTYTTRFTPDDLMKDHGSGAYQIMLNQQDPGTGKYSRVAVEKLQIINPKYPPVVPDGDWVDDKCNEMWKWGANAVPTSTNGPSYPPGFNVADMMDKADARALRMVEIMTPTPPPPDTTTALILGKLLDATLKPAAPPRPDTTAMDRMFKMQDEMLKDMRDEIRSLREKQTAPPKNIVEQFIELKPAIGDLVSMFASKAGKTDVWAEIAKEGIGQLPDLIQLGRDMVSKKVEPEKRQNKHHKETRVISTQVATVTTEPSGKAVAEMTEDEKRAHVDHLWKKWGGHLLQISSRLVEEFKVQDQGYSYRDWYVEMYGKLRWAELKRDIPAELMANMYIAHEQLAVELAPPARLNLFLVQFFTNFGEEADFTPTEDGAAGVEPGNEGSAAAQPEAN